MCYLKRSGTYDLIGKDSIVWKYVIDELTRVSDIYNYKYIKTPIFESTEIFHDMIGKNTDVVSKELYNFYDKNNDNISLRPEGTTGVVRSYIENKLYLNEDVSKLYYYGSMFRHENVEVGRYREFQQFGVEVFNDNSPFIDVEVISLAVNMFKNLGIEDIKVYINNLGSMNNKISYENALRDYFKPYLSDLCEDCKRRYKENPIRILDCKIDKRCDVVLNSPKIDDFIDEDSKKRFEQVINGLNELGIDYEINKKLVRGLNYYTDTVFEIKTNLDGYGSRNTICGGGRYNNSVESNNKFIPAIGFAIGIERLIDILENKNLLGVLDKTLDYNILFMDISLLNVLRNNGFKSDYNSKEMSFYTIDKEKDNYILIDNIHKTEKIYSYDELIKKIVSDN